MKRPVMTLVTAAALCSSGMFVTAPVYAQAQAASAQPATDNDSLEDAIETKWEQDSVLKNADIDVEVVSHVATLTGKVSTAALKSRAGRLAKVSGVDRVENNIIVDPTANETLNKAERAANKTAEGLGTAAGATKEGVKTAAEKTKEGVGTAAGETKKAANKTGEAMSDSWVTGKVKAKFVGEDALKHSNISVHTKDGVVTLSGTVATEAGRDRAIAIAKATDGAKTVVDKLTIAPGTN